MRRDSEETKQDEQPEKTGDNSVLSKNPSNAEDYIEKAKPSPKDNSDPATPMQPQTQAPIIFPLTKENLKKLQKEVSTQNKKKTDKKIGQLQSVMEDNTWIEQAERIKLIAEQQKELGALLKKFLADEKKLKFKEEAFKEAEEAVEQAIFDVDARIYFYPSPLLTQKTFEEFLTKKLPLQEKELPKNLHIKPGFSLSGSNAQGILWNDNTPFVFEVWDDHKKKITDINTTPEALYEEFFALLKQRYPEYQSDFVGLLEAPLDENCYRPVGEKLFLLFQYLETKPFGVACEERWAMRQALYNQHKAALSEEIAKTQENASPEPPVLPDEKKETLKQLRERFQLAEHDLLLTPAKDNHFPAHNMVLAYLSTTKPDEKSRLIEKTKDERNGWHARPPQAPNTADERLLRKTELHLVRESFIDAQKKLTQEAFNTLYEKSQALKIPLDLSDLDLSNIDFSNKDLTGARFDRATLEGAIFEFNVNADKSKKRALNCILDGCSFEGVQGKKIKFKMGENTIELDVENLNSALDKKYTALYEKKWRKTEHAVNKINRNVNNNNDLQKLLQKIQHADQVISKARFWNNSTTHEALCETIRENAMGNYFLKNISSYKK